METKELKRHHHYGYYYNGNKTWSLIFVTFNHGDFKNRTEKVVKVYSDFKACEHECERLNIGIAKMFTPQELEVN